MDCAGSGYCRDEDVRGCQMLLSVETCFSIYLPTQLHRKPRAIPPDSRCHMRSRNDVAYIKSKRWCLGETKTIGGFGGMRRVMVGL